MKNYTKEEVKELLEVGYIYPDSVRYCEEFHHDFYNCLADDIKELFYKANTLGELKEILENTNVISGVYSSWFGEYFTDVEMYEEAVKNNDRIYNLVKYENLKDIIIIQYGDDEEIYIKNFFDIEMTIKNIEQSIKHQIDIIENVQVNIEDYNQSIEAFIDKELDLFELALEFAQAQELDSYYLRKMLMTTTQEQGLDDIREELNNLVFEHIEEIKKIKEVEEFKENLEQLLSVKSQAQAKRMKI